MFLVSLHAPSVSSALEMVHRYPCTDQAERAALLFYFALAVSGNLASELLPKDVSILGFDDQGMDLIVKQCSHRSALFFLTVQYRLASNSWQSSWLSLLSAKITDVYHHVGFQSSFLCEDLRYPRLSVSTFL